MAKCHDAMREVMNSGDGTIKPAEDCFPEGPLAAVAVSDVVRCLVARSGKLDAAFSKRLYRITRVAGVHVRIMVS